MPIQAPTGSTGRILYGPVSVLTPTADTTDANAVGYVSVALNVYRTQSGGSPETDLQTTAGSPITKVTPDATTGNASWLGPASYTGTMWLEDPVSGTRFPVHPSLLPEMSGSSVTWDTLPGRPLVVAAGDTAQAARDAVAAQSTAWVPTKTDVGLGNVDNTTDLGKPVSTATAASIALNRSQSEATVVQRANHTGTQLAATISDFNAAVDARLTTLGLLTTVAPATDVPTNVTASGSTSTPYTITVNWGAPVSIPAGKTFVGYAVNRDNPYYATGNIGTGLTYQLTNFSAGTPYTCGVKTLYSDGTASNYAFASPVTFTSGTGGTSSVTPQAYPTHVTGMYHMIYTVSSYPTLATTPAAVNVLKLAFMYGDPLSVAGYAAEGTATAFGNALKALRANGVRIVMSVGGGGNSLNTGNRTGFVQSLMDFTNNVCPLDGLDWDYETGTLNQSDVLAISSSLKTQRGSNFAITMAPNGSNIDQYIPIAQALNSAGNLSGFGQQFYDAPVSDAAMQSRLQQYVSAGLPISKYEIGMMEPMSGDNAANYWDLATCQARLSSAKAAYPTLGGAYLWERSRTGAGTWASTIGGTIAGW